MKKLFPLVVVLGLFSATGCVVTSHDYGPNEGDVVVEWEINGSIDPGLCTMGAATTLVVDLVNAAGQSLAPVSAPCTAFATTVALPPGVYTGYATLLGANGAARTTSLQLPDFDVFRGQTSGLPTLSFPSSSFLP